jgi:transcriptional regulator with XRE-family HTH domain
VDAPDTGQQLAFRYPHRDPARAAIYADATKHWHIVIQMLGQSVRELRRALGWSQMALATRAIVSQGAVSRVEAGIDNVPFRTVAQLLHVLGHAAIQVELPVTPATAALVAFADPALGPILATDLDPDFVVLTRSYHRLPATYRRALVACFTALTTPVLDDPVPPPIE